MRYLRLTIVALLATALATAAAAQDQNKATPKSTSSGTAPADQAQASPAQTAMQNAATAGKYLFIHFWRENNTQADRTWKTLKASAAKYADSADVVSVRTTDPADKAIVDKFNVAKSPMPLILSVGPTGAVTKAFPVNFDEKQLASAFVSPGEERCMKAIQGNKMVFVCVVFDKPAEGDAAIPQGVKDFQADKQYASVTEVITLTATDEKEAGFLKELQVDAKAKKPVSVLLAPGALIGTFDSTADKKQIVAKLSSAQSGCCPGGKCGPGGCCPKK